MFLMIRGVKLSPYLSTEFDLWLLHEQFYSDCSILMVALGALLLRQPHL